MVEEKKTKAIQAAKELKIYIGLPSRYCKNCGADLDEYCRDSRYTIAAGVTLCPACFFGRFLKGGKHEV